MKSSATPASPNAKKKPAPAMRATINASAARIQRATAAAFKKTLMQDFGLSEQYADAAWLSVRSSNVLSGVQAANAYARRFNINRK